MRRWVRLIIWSFVLIVLAMVLATTRTCGDAGRAPPALERTDGSADYLGQPALPSAETEAPEEPATDERKGESPSPWRSRKRFDLEVAVLGPDVRPVPGAEVEGSRRVKRLTDDAGSVRLLAQPALAPFVVRPPAREPHSALIGTHGVARAPGRCVVRLAAARVVSVRVFLEDGSPPGEDVLVRWRRTDLRDTRSQRPGEFGQVVVGLDGRAEIPLGEGEYRISAGPRPLSRTPLASRSVERVTKDSGEITLVIGAAAPIAATVAGPAGAPLRGWLNYRIVPAGRPFREPIAHGTVGSNGRLQTRPLAVGEKYDVYLLQANRSQGTVGWGVKRGVTPGKDAGQIRFDAGGTISGRVEDPDGVPVTRLVGIHVAVDDVGDAMDMLAYAKPDEEGRFEVRGLPPWPLRVSASHFDWYTPEPLRDVRAGATGLVVVVHPSLSLRGRVAFEGTDEILGGKVEARVDGGWGSSEDVREDGRFEIRNLRPGLHRLTLRVHPWGSVDLGEVTLPTDRELALKVRLP
jgi:hypothetical protein